MTDALGPHLSAAPRSDYFSERDGQRFAGTHLIVDMWGARHLGDARSIEAALRAAAHAARAVVLHGHFHVFTAGGGVTGVLLLAESHMSIHTWPENGFAAVDFFMCAGCDPQEGMDTLQAWFAPQRISVQTLRRGTCSATA